MIHELKVKANYFAKLASGEKNFEARIDDRDFEVGDTLYLGELEERRDSSTGKQCYTGSYVTREITYIMRGGRYGIAQGWVIMALKTVDLK